MAEVEVFTPTGVLAGTTARVPLSNDGPDLSTPFALGDARWYPIDGGPATRHGTAQVDPDDVLLIVTPAPEMTIHMTWYSIVLDVGPYRVTGSLATHPGFDPERALARPGGPFIPLRDATIELAGRDDTSRAERACVHVNRYAVERVASTLMLGFFFPGARLAQQEPQPAA